MKAAFYTLGCKVNQYETQALEQLLSRRGHIIVSFEQNADVYVVNTCSVTAASDRKSRQLLRRVRREHPYALLAVCGCFPQTHPDELPELDADVIAGTSDRTGFVSLLEQAFARKSAGLDCCQTAVDKVFARREFEQLPAGRLENRTRAMLKIEDGCTNFCAYCVIPYARGPVRSLPLETAVEQSVELARSGVREIVLTGIEISSWGRDFQIRKHDQTDSENVETLSGNGVTLIDLLKAVCEAVPDVRIRLGSLEPRTVTETFCHTASGLANLCPQFHLSLQSGCDATLRRMNRKYDTARYFESVTLLNQSFKRPAVTTDIITGFPGETDDEFQQTLQFLRKCGFARIHVFPYSQRPGTPAADMVQIPETVRKERAAIVSRTALELQTAYLSGCVGEIYPVLFEQPHEHYFTGHAPNYAEIRVESVLFPENPHNQIVPVKILSTDNGILYGIPAETS